MNCRLLKPLLIFLLIGAIDGTLHGQSKSCDVGSRPDSNQQYFPDGAFNTPSPRDDSTAKWYACTLAALKEPSLFGLRSSESNQVYRFLWLPSFHDPIAVRLTINSNGRGSLVVKSVDLKSGLLSLKRGEKSTSRGSGKLTVDNQNEANETQVREVLQQLEALQFWAMATEEAPAIDREPQTNNSETMVPVPPVDGARWILEGVRDGEYHVVDRWSPKDDSYARLCRYFLMLGRVEEKNIY